MVLRAGGGSIVVVVVLVAAAYSYKNARVGRKTYEPTSTLFSCVLSSAELARPCLCPLLAMLHFDEIAYPCFSSLPTIDMFLLHVESKHSRPLV